MCGCNKPKPAPEPNYEVTAADGTRKTVVGEHAAKVAVTMNGGTYRRV